MDLYTSVSNHVIILQAIKNRKLKPSTCTWAILQKSGLVPDFLKFLDEIEEVTKAETPRAVDFQQYLASLRAVLLLMKRNTAPENEGFSQHIAAPLIAAIVQVLNDIKKNTVLQIPHISSTHPRW